jgi:hypothetical protein
MQFVSEAMSTKRWTELNRERGLLIDKSVAGALSAAERIRLDTLNRIADRRLDSPRFRKLLPPELERLIEQPAPQDLRGVDKPAGNDLCDTCGRSGVEIDHLHNGKTVCAECAETCEICAVEEDVC